MGNRHEEFWEIVESEFPEHIGDRFLELQASQSPRLGIEEEDRLWERRVAASYDERIADYFLDGVGDEESLLAQLQGDYELSKQETIEAVDRGLGQLDEVVDYGDEA